MKRREFITLLGGAAATWPAVAQAQRPMVMRRVGVLTGAFGPDSQARVAVFLQALAQLGWMEGQNVRLEIRQGGGDFDKFASMRPNWRHLARTSSWLSVARLLGYCFRRLVGCRLCLQSCPIQLARVSLKACRGQAATPPVSSNLNTA